MADSITPPPELVQQWMSEYINTKPNCAGPELIANRAAQWGADAELEACCEWLEWWNDFTAACQLRAARRPKPPSLKEEAMQALCRFMAREGHDDCTGEEIEDDFNAIRRALEALPND